MNHAYPLEQTLMISEPGFYECTMAEYLGDPAPAPSFSASIGKLLLQMSPLHAWLAHPRLGNVEAESNAKTDFGSVVHELVLGAGSQYRILDVDNFLTKVAKAERDAAIADGCIPIKRADLERATAAAKKIRSQLPDIFRDGVAEQTMIWRDGDIWCRARPDWLIRTANMVFDLKVTGVSLSPLERKVERHIFEQWYDFAIAHYMDGYRRLVGEELEYRLLFIEDHPPFSIRPFRLTGQGIEMGQRKLEAARSRWRSCMKNGKWPGIVLELGLADPEPWQAAGWLTYDDGLSEHEFATATAMQAPLGE